MATGDGYIISYSYLGVNQLGAVYEALLSYRGFYAEEGLYEVKRAGDKVDELDVGYFMDKELPGLKGFSARNLRYMRTFYEEWIIS